MKQVVWFSRIAFAGLAAALLVAPLAGAAAEPYRIDAILPLTGPAAFLGKEEAQALDVLKGVVNKTGGIAGRPVEFAIQDDQSNPQLGVELSNRVLAQKPAVLLGSSLVAICNAMTPLMKDGPLDYCFSPGIHPAAGSYVFSSSISTIEIMQASARYFSQRGWKKVAIITSTDATGQDAERTIDAAFGPEGKYGESIVDREHFNTSDLNVTAQMTRIAGSGAQAVIAWSTGTPVATLLRGIQDAGLNLPVMTGDGNMTYAQMHAYKDFLPKELYIAAVPAFAPEALSGPVREAVRTYLDAFKAVGVRPDIGQSLAWDPALLVIDALRKLGPAATANQIRTYIANLKGWAGINGVYDFQAMPQRGVGLPSIVMVKWDPAKDTWIGVTGLGGAPLGRK